jgi:hypothetical protein
LDKAAEHADHKVLMEVDDSRAFIVGNNQGILGQQLRPPATKLFNIFGIIFITFYNIYY